MDKIAIISDIHGNIPALNSVIADLRGRDVSRVICLGDIIGKGPLPIEAMDLVFEVADEILLGNWEVGLSTQSATGQNCWHKKRLGQHRLAILGSLPFLTQFQLSGKQVRLFHASPLDVFERIREDDSLQKRLTLFSSTLNTGDLLEPDIVGYGDIHHAFFQHISGKTLFNPGSVGNPLDVPLASYAILEGVFGSTAEDALNIQIIKVPYDIGEAIALAERENVPHLKRHIQELRTGKYQRPTNT